MAAVLVGHYGDGVPRPALYILADQAPAIIAFVLHTAAVIEMHARRPDGELLRIIRLFRERGLGLEVLAETCAAPIPSDTAEEVNAIQAISA